MLTRESQLTTSGVLRLSQTCFTVNARTSRTVPQIPKYYSCNCNAAKQLEGWKGKHEQSPGGQKFRTGQEKVTNAQEWTETEFGHSGRLLFPIPPNFKIKERRPNPQQAPYHRVCHLSGHIPIVSSSQGVKI